MMLWKRIASGLAAMLVLGLLGGTGFAKVKVDPACESDAVKLCKATMQTATTETSVFDCLAGRKTELSQSCRGYVDSREVCEADFGKYCKGMIFEDIRTCLVKHKMHVAQSCRDKMGWTNTTTGQSSEPALARKDAACVCMNDLPPATIEQECMASK